MTISMQDFATAIIAVATVVYTGGTFLLWWVSRRNVQILERQLLLLEEQLQRQAAFNKVLVTNAILDAHREIWLPIISNPSFLNLLQKTELEGSERTAAEFLGSILINHCARIHLNFQHGLFGKDELEAFSRDARYLFSFPLVKWRWERAAKYHSEEFIRFVQAQISA